MTTETLPARTAPLGPRERTAADVLLAAARYIEEHGWAQGSWQDDDGRVCVMGAIGAIVYGDPFRCGEESRGVEYVLRNRREMRQGIAVFNDAPDRTEADVIRALRDAAQDGGR